MGLGKTVQTISLLAYLMEEKQNSGPFLVIVPLSTMSNWASEFARWAPDINVVRIEGAPAARRAIYKARVKPGNFNVVLTTYELALGKIDRRYMTAIQWRYVVIDEGHRMKNVNAKLPRMLREHYRSERRLLLTGTPLQNELSELWALLNFTLPSIFNSLDNFEKWFASPFQVIFLKKKKIK